MTKPRKMTCILFVGFSAVSSLPEVRLFRWHDDREYNYEIIKVSNATFSCTDENAASLER